jgi:hypothetical protein
MSGPKKAGRSAMDCVLAGVSATNFGGASAGVSVAERR